MKIALNYRKSNQRLKEGIESSGHEVRENIWDINKIISERIEAAVFEFKYIFKEKWKFLSLAYKLKQHGIPTVTWNVDSPWNGGISRWKVNMLLKRSRLLSLYATHSLQDTDQIKHIRIVYLPNAAWTSKYNLRGLALEDLRRPDIYRWDVSFIGNMDSGRYPEHRHRIEFLKRLGRFLKQRKVKFLFVDSKDLSFDEQVRIIQESKINLSCLGAADSSRYGKSWGLPERCYGIPACGGFLLMEERIHVKNDSSIGDEVVTYSDIEDSKNKIFYYLDKHEERRKIAEKAYRKVIKEHTYMHRARKLISEIQNLKNNVNFQTN